MSQSNIYARGENGITPPFSADSRRHFNGAIPIQRRRYISESEIPGDYSKTPGGTLFGTTPGGSKIIYEIEQMKKLRSSPLAQTPPRNLPFIPGVTKNIHVDPLVNKQILNDLNNNRFKPANKVAPKIIEERADTDFMMEL